jgi:hypothetical protein
MPSKPTVKWLFERNPNLESSTRLGEVQVKEHEKVTLKVILSILLDFRLLILLEEKTEGVSLNGEFED